MLGDSCATYSTELSIKKIREQLEVHFDVELTPMKVSMQAARMTVS